MKNLKIAGIEIAGHRPGNFFKSAFPKNKDTTISHEPVNASPVNEHPAMNTKHFGFIKLRWKDQSKNNTYSIANTIALPPDIFLLTKDQPSISRYLSPSDLNNVALISHQSMNLSRAVKPTQSLEVPSRRDFNLAIKIIKNRGIPGISLHGDGVRDKHIKKLKKLKLKTVNLSECSYITSKGVKYIPRTVTHLNLSKCNPSVKSIKYIPPTVTHLDLSHNYSLTDNSIKDIPHTVTHLDLSYYTNLTNACLQHIPPNITYLNLRTYQYAQDITNAGIADLRKRIGNNVAIIF